MTPMPILPDPAIPAALRRPGGQSPVRAGDARLRQACEDFEGLFAGILLRQMRRTVPKNGLFGEGTAMREYHQIFDMTMARHVARAGGLGIAKAMYAQLAPPAASPEGGSR
jgi:flagellar protein FlgJ